MDLIDTRLAQNAVIVHLNIVVYIVDLGSSKSTIREYTIDNSAIYDVIY